MHTARRGPATRVRGIVGRLGFGLLALSASAGAVWAGPLNPMQFTSLGPLVDELGTHTIDTTTARWVGPGGITHQGVLFEGIAVFTFDDIALIQSNLQISGSNPIALLSQLDVNISTNIDISGGNAGGQPPSFPPGVGGPGGGVGGSGTGLCTPEDQGQGPGGGTLQLGGGFGGAGGGPQQCSPDHPEPTPPGAPYGDLATALQGGSGGGGSGTDPGGGGGGGAIEIGAVGKLVFVGSIQANGGDGGSNVTLGMGGGGGGSGGAIFLHGSQVTLSTLSPGVPILQARGGDGGAGAGVSGSGAGGGGGRVLIEYGAGGFSDDLSLVDVSAGLSPSNAFPPAPGAGVKQAIAAPPPPSACGGGVPCACGDRVVKNHTLRGTDPVTRMVCPVDGLVVAGGVTLDLGGATLRGQGAGAGVRIEAGAANVTVRRGKVSGFSTGVRGEEATGTHLANLQLLDNALAGVHLAGDAHTVETAVIKGNGVSGVVVLGSGSRLSKLQIRSNGRTGIRLAGDANTLERSTVEGNGEHGAEVSGDANHVALLRVEANRRDGVVVTGSGNTAGRNVAIRNGRHGLRIHGESATVDRNRATSNGAAGLEIHGTGHAVTQNITGQNAGTGLQIVGTTESRFDRNRGEGNGVFGITDDSTGEGTAGTANTHTGNRCGRANGAGASQPEGACR